MPDQSASAMPPALPASSATEHSSALSEYLPLLLRRKWMIFAVTVGVVSLTAAWTYTRLQIYTATTTIIIEKQAPQVLGNKVNEVVDLSTGHYWSHREYMRTQERVLQSYALAEKLVDHLRLHKNPQFWLPAKEGKGETDRSRKAAATRLQYAMVAHNPKDSNIIEVKVEHHNPQLAAEIANGAVRVYMDQNLEYKRSATVGAAEWLAKQLDDLRKQLGVADSQLHQFKKTNNIVSVTIEDKQSLLSKETSQISEALTRTRLNRIEVEARRDRVKRFLNGKLDPLNVPLQKISEDVHIRKLKEDYSESHQHFVKTSASYLKSHPAYIKARAAADTSLAELTKAVRNVLLTTDDTYRTLRSQETKLAAALQDAKDRMLRLNAHEVQYNQLARARENTAKMHSLVLSRMKESTLSSQLHFNNIRPLDAARPPKFPSKPRPLLSLMMGLVLGLFLGVVLAFLLEFMDSSVAGQEHIEEIEGLTYLGLVPGVPGSQAIPKSGRRPIAPDVDLIVHRDAKSVVAEHWRLIRTNLLFSSPDQKLKRLLISSAGPREGKTTTTTSIAITMAQAGNRVLAIDTDMRRPRLHKVFGVPGGEGISNVLLGDVEVDDVIRATEIPNLFVLPCGAVPPNPAEICQSESFKRLLDELDGKFDQLILDSPPSLAVADAMILATNVDGTVLVCLQGATNRGALRTTARGFQSVGAQIFGCVVNGVSLERRGYGYSYYRYRRYGKYGYQAYGYGLSSEED